MLSIYKSYKADLGRCLKMPLEALKACTGDQGDADFDSLSQAVMAAVDYACSQGGDNIVSKFFSFS